MKSRGYESVTGKIDGEAIGLGWINGVTLWSNVKATSMRRHSHPDMELLFCLRGELVYEIEGSGSVKVRQGSGMVIPRNTMHMLEGGTDVPCERLGLHIAASVPRGSRFAVFTASDFASLSEVMLKNPAVPFRLDATLSSAVKELSAIIKSGICRTSAGRSLVRILCSSVFYRTSETLSRPLASARPQLMGNAVEFFNQHYAERITTEDLIRYMGYGRTRLFELFKAHTGLPPNEYIVRLRVKKAQEKMQKPGCTVADVAKSCGFENAAYFSSVFRKYTGLSPTRFMKKAASGCRREKGDGSEP